MNREKLTIGPFTVTERDHDWHACWTGSPELWGCAPTVDSAIGSVVRSHPELVGGLDPQRALDDDYDPRAEAIAGKHYDPAEAAVMHATVYVGDQVARIADVLEESAKVGGIAHAVPTTILEVVRALDRQTKAIEDGGTS